MHVASVSAITEKERKKIDARGSSNISMSSRGCSSTSIGCLRRLIIILSSLRSISLDHHHHPFFQISKVSISNNHAHKHIHMSIYSALL
mmetsp:Transcript_55794/g.135192  ORF Transcript_55794/g.135192 Transcript_55794/m.135192 type:complete len:89 (-) Transcript_55794:71-337(-)